MYLNGKYLGPKRVPTGVFIAFVDIVFMAVKECPWNRGTPIQTPKYYNPYYGDPE